MKSIFVISPHSFVDVITNSSSELFVCNTDKSVETVKEVLVKLTKIHNEKTELACGVSELDVTTLFENVFKEPTVAQYTFSMYEYPNRDDYWDVCLYERYSDHPVYVKAREEAYKWEKANAIDYNNTTEKERTAYYRKRGKSLDKIEKEWKALQHKQRYNLLKWAFEQNNIPWPLKGKLPKRWDDNSEFWEIAQEFENAIDWDYSFKKGDIFIESQSDNTIPYWMFDDIENIFRATRRHLG